MGTLLNLERYLGTLWGGALGDALGAPLEGSGPDYARLDHPLALPLGDVTDDTDLTVCVGETLIAQGFFDPDDFSQRLVAWLPSGRGIGKATRKAGLRLTSGVPWYHAGELSAGNGAAMRASPIGLRWPHDLERLRHEAVLSALPTHTDPAAVAGAVAVAAGVAFLIIRSGSLDPGAFLSHIEDATRGLESRALRKVRRPSGWTTLSSRIHEVAGLVAATPERALSALGCGGFVLESVPAALYAFLHSPDDPVTVLATAICGGRDADTVASMAGTFVGAHLGSVALPEVWLAQLKARPRLERLAVDLHRLASSA